MSVSTRMASYGIKTIASSLIYACISSGAHSETARSEDSLSVSPAAVIRYCNPRLEDSADKSSVSDRQLRSLREQYRENPSPFPFSGLSKEELNVVAEALRVGPSAGYFAHRILRDLIIVEEMERLSKCSSEPCKTTADIEEIRASTIPNGSWTHVELWKSVTKTDIQGGKACMSIAQSMSTYSVPADAELARSDVDQEKPREMEIKHLAVPSECREEVVKAARGITIKFSKSDYRVFSKYQPIVANIARALDRCKELTVAIEGYADSDGSIKYNQLLSEHRAAAVVSALVSNGVDAQRLKAMGFGKSRQKPLNGRQTSYYKEENRRVEVVLK